MTDSKRPNILVVDDEKYICSVVEEALAADKYDVVALTNPKQALEYIENNHVDLVLTDLVMGEYSGVQVLESALAQHPDAVIILMTAHPTVQTAISVLKKGGYDFLVKPFKLEQLRTAIKRGLDHQRMKRDNLTLRGQVEFLKVVNAAGAGTEIVPFLDMVVDFCLKEFSASAVGIIQIDPKTRETIRKAQGAASESVVGEVLDESTILKFAYTRSPRPHVQVEKVQREDGHAINRILVSRPIFVRRKLHGVINLLMLTTSNEIIKGQLDVLNILGNSVASAIENQRLYQFLRSSYLQAIGGLANAIEARDPYTAGHTDRVCQIAEVLARHLGWDETAIYDLIMGCTLHDIGKIGVPDSILKKPGKLTAEELASMQSHPMLGLKIIKGIDLFKPATPYIIAHHERFDGKGYPRGLKGENIPVEGRLLAVVDCFDAILSDRPYRQGAGVDVAVKELVENKGTQFDPTMVDAFMEVLGKGRIDIKELYDYDDDVAVPDAPVATEKV
ncbi:MAG: response regulator [candidate division Zixibacteria bacterium]|nr:response regulator [candidate division Zixibacteria bacterium]